MNSDRLSRHLLIAFLLSLALYVAGYWFIEGRRVADTPWVVEFQSGSEGQAEIEIRQDSLGRGPVRIRIETTNIIPAVARQEVIFNTPRPVPFAVPLGQCIFQDTTFLPGTVVLEISGVTIQMLPRALTIGTNEFTWTTNSLIVVPPAGRPAAAHPP
jgi:hypothetical protein